MTMRPWPLLLAILLALWSPALAATPEPLPAGDPAATIARLSSLPERTTGSEGGQQAAAAIEAGFHHLGLSQVGRQGFLVPVRTHGPARLRVTTADGAVELPVDVPVDAMECNALSPAAADGLSGPLIYAGHGTLAELDGLPVSGAIVLMELDSGRNWQNAADLGAKALIYLDDGQGFGPQFADKRELTPVAFPRLHLDAAAADRLLPGLRQRRLVADQAVLDAHSQWQRLRADNVYALVPGSDSRLNGQLLVVEAFYDTRAYVAGRAPGAEEAASVAALLDLARNFKEHPPARPVLLLATAGQAQGLAGWREFLWTVTTKGKVLKEAEQHQKARCETAAAVLEALDPAKGDPLAGYGPPASPLTAALEAQIKDEADALATRLMQLRLQPAADAAAKNEIRGLEARRSALQRLLWSDVPKNGEQPALPAAQRDMLLELLPRVVDQQRAVLADSREQLACLKSAKALRGLLESREVAASVSLRLSSHGNGLVVTGNAGFAFEARADQNSGAAYGDVSRVVQEAADGLGSRPRGGIVNALRPGLPRPWQSYLPDAPQLGGEFAGMAGILGLSLTTADDFRSVWGTPQDTPEKIDLPGLRAQLAAARLLVDTLASTPADYQRERPRQGFATLEGRAEFLRQGELFPERAAPGVVVQANQDHGTWYAMTDTEGVFLLKGLGSKKLVAGKVALEAYRFDAADGRATWAIDKRATGKEAYRLRLSRQTEHARLVMFAAAQQTIFGLTEPRTFEPLTKISVFDGRRDAEPGRFWFSRIDTRDSTLLSMFLEPEVPLKLTLSDTVLGRKLILSNATEGKPEGQGYAPAMWPDIPATELHAATDMWRLVVPRLANLEACGVINERLQDMRGRGLAALRQADSALEGRHYAAFMEASRTAWALALRVYNDVERTQRDVLLGVLFYIAMFGPFAYCAERLLFAFADIHRRIVAFLGILGGVIAVVYAVHPAFQLTYSPLVVILAFFILGLSGLVAGIIFLRFEREMLGLRQRAGRLGGGAGHGGRQLGLAAAMGAAAAIGVSNLRRRRARTALTCLTLVILTFTIMSFTAVKSVRQNSAQALGQQAAYDGVLLRRLDWSGLPPEAGAVLDNALDLQPGVVHGPRVWLRNPAKTLPAPVAVNHGKITELARGLVGLGAAEPRVSGMDKALAAGRWLALGETRAVLLPVGLARRLGIAPERFDASAPPRVRLWDMDFRVVGLLDERAWAARPDLDGEPLTPAVFPSDTLRTLAEQEAADADGGEAVQNLQGRYEHLPEAETIVIPADTALALGGELMAVAAKPAEGQTPLALARQLADRFGLTVFAGEGGRTFLLQASEAIAYSGVPNLAVPLLIAALIVLNTMISSVHERKREIAVYTSVGMAPTHVSLLFVAEALAFAVLSTVLGYLLAQTSARLLAGSPMWAGMTANYSSTAGVAAMLLVMAVVLLSVIYPSRVAAGIAIPDVNRSWTMPPAHGDRIEARLPFLLRYQEQGCVGGYLLDYYQSYQDSTHGRFASADVGYRYACPLPTPGRAAPSCLRLDFKTWLAPFDFGVRQHVDLVFCPSDISEEFLEIEVRLTRESGEAGAWARLNKGFLNDLRKQLLAFRSLDDDDRQDYAELIQPAGDQ